MKKEEIWFWLCSTEGIYSESIGRLLNAYGSVEAIFSLTYQQYVKDRVIPENLAFNLTKGKKSEEYKKKYEKMKKSGIDFYYFEEESFPARLKNIPDHPYCLYVRGRLPGENLPSCAIVGARACSKYGEAEAVNFAYALAQNGIQIISGMALGIDSIAQKAALEAGGSTFAVLGGGVDVIYPAENISLYYEIIEKGGGIISEYPPGTASLPWQFPHRNRIIAGLSDKLLIMEARKRSGTLSTARHALDQGKDIFALPGRVKDPLSEGCNELIYDGAGILLNPSFIINDFFLESETGSICRKDAGNEELSGESSLIKYLSYHAKNIEEISKEAQMSIEEVIINLAVLELEGRVKEVGKDFYVRV